VTERPTEPEVVILPDPEDIVFDERGTPMLTYERHPEHGSGWMLRYLEDDSLFAGVADHFIGGGLADIDWALEEARKWLRLIAERRAE
jgi:hypothetical protein